MRIVSGDYKYRKLEIPADMRPTTEKVREAIFSMIAFDIPEAVVLDIFAGSGSLGLEALSRGAAKCYFNDENRQTYRILKSNIEACKAEAKSILTNSDFRRCLGMINEKLDIVFIDPPYKEGYNNGWYEEAIILLEEYGLIKESTIVVCEHLEKYTLEEKYGSFVREKTKKYGSIGVDIYTFCID